MFDNDSEDNKRYKLIKPHSKQKLILIGGILFLMSRILKRKFIFIDLFCGEGLCKCDLGNGKIENEEIQGSSLLVLDKFNDMNYSENLEKIFCNDINGTKIEALKYWVNKKYPNLEDKVEFLNLDANEVWKKIKFTLSPEKGIIVFIDPDNPSTMIPFKSIKDISEFSCKEFFQHKPYYRRPELIINFMHYVFTRSWVTISSEKISEITGISITEIEEIRKNKKGKEFTDKILKRYSENIKNLGYKTILSYNVRNVENNTIIYNLMLASNHPSAEDLYEKKILKWAEKTKDKNIIIEKAHKKGLKTLEEFSN
jgi:three-Cys-motif partner protein